MRVKIWEDIIVVYNENTYYLEECCLKVYVGKLNKIIDVKGTENKLFWSKLDKKFFDETKYAEKKLFRRLGGLWQSRTFGWIFKWRSSKWRNKSQNNTKANREC